MPGLEPNLTEFIFAQLLEYDKQCQIEDKPCILLVHPALRALLEKVFKPSIGNLHILSHQEIPEDKQINVIANIGQPQGVTQ